MDVCVRTETTQEPAAHSGFTTIANERFVFDWEQNRFIYARSGERSSMGDDAKRMTEEVGFIVKDGVVRKSTLSDSLQDLNQLSDVNKLFDEFQVPDLRLTMFPRLNQGRSLPWGRRFESRFDWTAQETKDVNSLGLTADGSIRFSVFDERKRGSRYEFDATSLLPKRTEIISELVRLDNSDQPHIIDREDYQWTSINSIHVPTEILGEYLERQTSASGPDLERLLSEAKDLAAVKAMFQDAKGTRDVKFHWFSVNEDFEDDRFEFSRLDNPSEFVRIADPNVNGATDIK
jgi:hypothetical protein